MAYYNFHTLAEFIKTTKHNTQCIFTCVYGVYPGKKSGSGWRTNRLYIVIIQYYSFTGNVIYVRGADLWVVKPYVAPPSVIHNYQQNM